MIFEILNTVAIFVCAAALVLIVISLMAFLGLWKLIDNRRHDTNEEILFEGREFDE